MESTAPRIAEAEGPDLGACAGGRDEGVVGGDRTVRCHPQDLAVQAPEVLGFRVDRAAVTSGDVESAVLRVDADPARVVIPRIGIDVVDQHYLAAWIDEIPAHVKPRNPVLGQ